jgi:hypothetical protein
LPAEALVEQRPDFAILLVWNFADEVIAQQQEFRDKGGQFVIPLPELRVL